MKKGRQGSKESVNATILSQRKGSFCQVCENPLTDKKSNSKFCSPRCRLLFWAVKVLVKEWKAGRVNGLREMIQKLRS